MVLVSPLAPGPAGGYEPEVSFQGDAGWRQPARRVGPDRLRVDPRYPAGLKQDRAPGFTWCGSTFSKSADTPRSHLPCRVQDRARPGGPGPSVHGASPPLPTVFIQARAMPDQWSDKPQDRGRIRQGT
jgi:hypothetical protein